VNAPRRSLISGQVHVWAIPTRDSPLSEEALHPLLAPDEVERAGRFRSAEDRTRFVLGRGLVRILLGEYLGQAPSTMSLVAGAHGKPELQGGQRNGDVDFNVAHSGGWVLIGVARGLSVGVDVEQVRDFPGLEGIASRWFARGEAEEILGLPARRRVSAFFGLWTLKEACHKALGVGLHAPLDQFRFPVGVPVAAAPLSEVPGVQHEGVPWSVWNLGVEEGYAAAVAVDRAGVRPVVRFWTGSGDGDRWPTAR